MDRRDFLASKGTPHSVLLALVVEGPQTAADLADYMVMDPRAVKKALALLERLGLVVKDGGRWAMLAAVGLLGTAGDSHEVEGTAGSTGAVEGMAGSTTEGIAGSERAGNGAYVASCAPGERTVQQSERTAQQSERTAQLFGPLPPPPLRSSERRGEEEEEEEGGRTAQPASERGRVFRLLLEAGVGARSPKMRELLALGLEPGYVERFVAYRRENREGFPVGHLIQALQSGDPAPPAAPRTGYAIPAEYLDVVTR